MINLRLLRVKSIMLPLNPSPWPSGKNGPISGPKNSQGARNGKHHGVKVLLLEVEEIPGIFTPKMVTHSK